MSKKNIEWVLKKFLRGEVPVTANELHRAKRALDMWEKMKARGAHENLGCSETDEEARRVNALYDQ